MAAEGGLAFAFVEGALLRAVRDGAWLLLDEINLAPAEVSKASRSQKKTRRGCLWRWQGCAKRHM